MQYVEERFHLHVDFETKGCELPPDELTRMENSLETLGELVRFFPSTDLRFNLMHHPRRQAYHVEATLRLPGKTFFTGAWADDLDSAFQHCLTDLMARVNAYKEHPEEQAEAIAGDLRLLNRDIVAPEGPHLGVLGTAVDNGDYAAFRAALNPYEEWLRKRIGRWVQRYPEVEARIGRDVRLGDLLEEVYLNAFEAYDRWPTEVPFHEWLEGLIDPSLNWFMRHPEEERQNASFARTVRDMAANG